MEFNTPCVVYPPNRALERILSPSKTPNLYDFLFFLDCNKEEELILGCSNITGSYWEGTLFHYKNYSNFLTNQNSGYYISPSSTTDAKFINDSRHVVLAEDTGSLIILNLSTNGNYCIKESFATNARIEQLATWDDSHKVLTCADATIAIWDSNGNVPHPIEEYINYHTELVTSIDTNRSQPNLFASASYDRKALIWDNRMDIPATVLYENEFSSLTSINWNIAQGEYLTVGTAGGFVYNLDSRQPKEFLHSKQCFDAAVHRMASNDLGLLAVCGDAMDVLVLNSKDLDVCYKNSEHAAFVRGLAWSKETLYSCGFDRKVVKHEI